MTRVITGASGLWCVSLQGGGETTLSMCVLSVEPPRDWLPLAKAVAAKYVPGEELHRTEVNFMPVMNNNKPKIGNAPAVRPWPCFQSKRNPFISLERAFDHQNRP